MRFLQQRGNLCVVTITTGAPLPGPMHASHLWVSYQSTRKAGEAVQSSQLPWCHPDRTFQEHKKWKAQRGTCFLLYLLNKHIPGSTNLEAVFPAGCCCYKCAVYMRPQWAGHCGSHAVCGLSARALRWPPTDTTLASHNRAFQCMVLVLLLLSV